MPLKRVNDMEWATREASQSTRCLCLFYTGLEMVPLCCPWNECREFMFAEPATGHHPPSYVFHSIDFAVHVHNVAHSNPKYTYRVSHTSNLSLPTHLTSRSRLPCV